MSRYSPQLLRTTPQAEAWVKQFESEDRTTAALALESLRLISHTDFQNGLLGLLKNERPGLSSKKTVRGRPVALFAAREGDEEQEVREREDNLQHVIKSRRQPEAVVLPYFDPNDDRVRPNAVGLGAGVGSEGTVATLIRDLAGQDGGRLFTDHPSIHSMRSQKCREAFFVDDIIGSGKRACDFVDNVMQRKTLKSWHSRKHLRIKYIAYAGTEEGIARVRSHKFVDDVVVAKRLQFGRSRWTSAETGRIVSLCTEYSRRTKHWSIPLGYGKAFTFLVFEHKCPNTVPPIFWSTSRPNKWFALFNMRPGTGFSAWPVPEQQSVARQRILDQMGQPGLAKLDFDQHLSPFGQIRLLILAAVSKRLRKPHILSEVLGISEQFATQVLADCVKFEWLTLNHYITPKGLEELRLARRLGIAPIEEVPFQNVFYYPTTLREARVSI